MRDVRAELRSRTDPQAMAIKKRLAEICHRYAKRRRERGPLPFAALRMRDLEAVFTNRYGRTLPDDDSGREDARIAAHHLANLPRGDQATNVISWLAHWAPWMSPAQMGTLAAEAIEHDLKWKADTLAWRIRLTDRERKALRVTTIGAIDCGKVARAGRRKRADRANKQNRRRAESAIPRFEYEANSLAKTRPWEAVGISRATWFRRRKTPETGARETSASTAYLSSIAADGPVSTAPAEVPQAPAEQVRDEAAPPVPSSAALVPDGSGNLPEEQRPRDNKQDRAEGALSGDDISRMTPNRSGCPSLQAEQQEVRLAARDHVRPTEVDYLAALTRHQQANLYPLIRQGLAKLWNWFCACRRGVLRGGWEMSWQAVVKQERDAIIHFERRRKKTLAVIAKGKAAAAWATRPEAVEAARVKALTPEQRKAESNARMDVMSARYAESNARSAFLKLINQRSPRSPEAERQAAREAIELAEAERERLEANHKRIVEEHRLTNAKRRRAPEMPNEREIEAKRFRSLSRKQREAERQAEKDRWYEAYEDQQRALAFRNRIYAERAAP